MTQDFASIFDETARFLESRGVKPIVSTPSPADPDAVREFRETSGLDLPRSFLSFYTDFSNGYSFEWDQEPGNEDLRVAFIMPALDELAAMQKTWDEMIREDVENPHSMDDSIKQEHLPAAYRLMEKMRGWVPFIEEQDTGDSFCVSPEDGKILFSKLDWFDGFGEEIHTNGLIAGDSLFEFVEMWSRHCFVTMWFADSPHGPGDTRVEWDADVSQFVRG